MTITIKLTAYNNI